MYKSLSKVVSKVQEVAGNVVDKLNAKAIENKKQVESESSCAVPADAMKFSSKHIGKYCVVRTQTAGVFYGLLVQKVGDLAEIKNARRIWFWSGASSLSQLAAEGVKKPNDCKFPCAVESLELSGVIETIVLTDCAIKSLDSVPVWEQK